MRHRQLPPDDVLHVAAEAERAVARLGEGVDPAFALAVWTEANTRRRQREDRRLLIKIAVANALLQVGLRLSQPTPAEPEHLVEQPVPSTLYGDTFSRSPCAQDRNATVTDRHGDSPNTATARPPSGGPGRRGGSGAIRPP